MQDKLRIKISQTVNRTKIKIPILTARYRPPTETTHREVVIVIIVVKSLFAFDKTADAFVGAYPNIPIPVFSYGVYMGIGESIFPLIYYSMPIYLDSFFLKFNWEMPVRQKHFC